MCLKIYKEAQNLGTTEAVKNAICILYLFEFAINTNDKHNTFITVCF